MDTGIDEELKYKKKYLKYKLKYIKIKQKGGVKNNNLKDFRDLIDSLINFYIKNHNKPKVSQDKISDLIPDIEKIKEIKYDTLKSEIKEKIKSEIRENVKSEIMKLKMFSYEGFTIPTLNQLVDNVIKEIKVYSNVDRELDSEFYRELDSELSNYFDKELRKCTDNLNFQTSFILRNIPYGSQNMKQLEILIKCLENVYNKIEEIIKKKIGKKIEEKNDKNYPKIDELINNSMREYKKNYRNIQTASDRTNALKGNLLYIKVDEFTEKKFVPYSYKEKDNNTKNILLILNDRDYRKDHKKEDNRKEDNRKEDQELLTPAEFTFPITPTLILVDNFEETPNELPHKYCFMRIYPYSLIKPNYKTSIEGKNNMKKDKNMTIDNYETNLRKDFLNIFLSFLDNLVRELSG